MRTLRRSLILILPCALGVVAIAACPGHPTPPTLPAVDDAVQRWEAPTTWGPVWPDTPTMVQHAWFGATASAIQEQRGVVWSVVNGPLPPPKPLDALPGGAVTRYGSGPFDGAAAPRWQATAGDAALDLAGDMLVCAIVKPGYDPTFQQDGLEKGIVAKGVGFSMPPDSCAAEPSRCGAGWVLMQMHSQFCFHYQSKDANGTYANMIFTPTFFADRDVYRTGPLNASYVAVCGGRAGDTIAVAANDATTTVTEFGPNTLRGTAGSILLDPIGVTGATHHATIGGYDSAAGHQLGGRVYEVAVWNEPATVANIQAKLAAFQGLALNATDPTPVRYLRNREGPYLGPDGAGTAYHTTWRHGPRFDPAKGLLFGLQSWNRLSHCITSAGSPISCEDPSTMDRWVVAPGEELQLWTASGGATVDGATTAIPPGDSEQSTAALVTLPPAASLSAPLLAFDGPGAVHGQIWLRVPAATSGMLRITTAPAHDPADRVDIDLATIQPGTWKRFWLKGLTTTGEPGTMTIQALPSNVGAVSFFGWGVDVTQISGGGDLGTFDPGPVMYDWSTTIGFFGDKPEDRPVHALDALELPQIGADGGTAATGFCLSIDAQPFDGLAWTAPFVRNRGLLAWVSTALAAQLYATGTSDVAGPGRLCFSTVRSTGARAAACGAVPGSWAAGSKHNVKGCLSASGALRVYADDTNIAMIETGLATVPDVNTGRVWVGNLASGDPATWSWTGAPAPWNGYASKALVCRDPGSGGSTASCR